MKTSFSEIENEIKLKRFKPEYLITLFEEYFKKLDSSYPTSFREVLRYRRRVKVFLNTQKKLSKSLERATKLAKRFSDNADKILKRITNGEDITKLTAEAEEITRDIQIESELIEKYEFDKKEFHQLILLREDFLFRSKLASTALGSLIRSETFKFLTKAFTFILSFILAFYLGNYIQTGLQKKYGELFSQLVPTLLFFLTIDRIINWAEDKFLWHRVRYLFEKVKNLKLTEAQRIFFHENFTDD